MSKYIIELDDRINLVTSVGVTENGVVYTTSDYVHNLEELNSDYINEHYGQLQDEAYQAGLNDAWEAAKKIALMDTETSENVTGYFGLFRIMENLTAMQAIEKLKTYESKQKDRIEVGDEVEWDGDKYVVTYLNYNIETSEITDYDLLAYDGSVVDHVKKCAFTKTGKHYDIASILEAMRK